MDNVELLRSLDKPIPRYTSYPTAPSWGPLQPEDYAKALQTLAERDTPIALYFHIPFCRTMCLFCGCSVVLNRRPENEERYVEYLSKEIALVAKHIGKKKRILQLHFGGGTPTKLSCELLKKLVATIQEHFICTDAAEIAIEIDPRTVFEDRGEKLHLLHDLGFNRVSFGVQDTNEKVQEAVRRRQSYEMTKYTFDLARSLQFAGISLDLIYGLPYQTLSTFQKTIQDIIDLHPDRVSLFSYAKIPWLKEHQKAIPEDTLPSTEEKFRIYLMARKALVEAGYKAIGMDHFALPTDDMYLAYKNKTLRRNFQGYTVLGTDDLLSFGITAIGYSQNGYFQNVKELSEYYSLLDQDILPIFRGKMLHQDDCIRRWVVERLMCDFRVDKEQFFARYLTPFDTYFTLERKRLEPLIALGLVHDEEHAIYATMQGEPFIRNITSCFDFYLHEPSGHKAFSKAI